MKLAKKIKILNRVKVLLEDVSFSYGLCDVLMSLVRNDTISIGDAIYIRELMEVHKPTPENQYKEFTNNDFWLGTINNQSHPLLGFWWKQMATNPETRQIRIDYLTRLIENIK